MDILKSINLLQYWFKSVSTLSLFILHINSFPGRPWSTYRPVFTWIIWETRLMESWQYFEAMVTGITGASLRVTIKFLIPVSFKGLSVKFTWNILIYNFWRLSYGHHRQGFCHLFFFVFKFHVFITLALSFSRTLSQEKNLFCLRVK